MCLYGSSSSLDRIITMVQKSGRIHTFKKRLYYVPLSLKTKTDRTVDFQKTKLLIIMFDLLSSTFPTVVNGQYNDKCVFLTESNTDASFLVSHFLNFSLKNSINVCFLMLSQSFGHYKNVSSKLGNNLNDFITTGSLVVIPGMKQLGAAICDLPSDDSPSDDSTSDDSAIWQEILKSGCLQKLYKNVERIVDNFSTPFVVCIDDIAVLLHIGLSFKAIVQFILC